MRRLIRSLVMVSFLLSAALPQIVHALSSPAGSIMQAAMQGETDDIAACADDPSPDLHGNNPGIAGKPVNLLSGVEMFTRTDITIGAIFPISISRRYDSRSSYDSPVGFGWAINYDRRLYTYPDGSVTLRKECGWKKRFVFSGGSYITPLGESGTLIKNADNSYTFTYKNGDKDVYDSRGRLISRIDRNGSSVAIYYELDVRSPLWGLLPANINQSTPLIVAYDYRLSRIEEKDASGTLTNRYMLFHYDGGTGRLTDIVDSNGLTVTYTYDSIGNLTGASGPNGSATYGFTDAAFKHKMTSVDEGQGAYVNTYDTKGRVLKQTHGTGVIDFEYITPFKKTKITHTIKDSAGTVLNTSSRTTEFDSIGQPSKSTDALGNVTIYTRNSNMYITREEFRENLGTVSAPTLTLMMANNYTYDDKGNMLTRTMAQGTAVEKTTTYTYHPVYNGVLTETVQSVVNPAQNRVVTNTYDETNGNLLTTTETGLLGNGSLYSYTATYTYYPNGKLWTIDGPRTDVTDVTTYTYTAQGDLASVTQPLVGTTTYANHDALGNPQTVTDPNNNSTTYTYDANGRVSTVKPPGDLNPAQYFYVSGNCGSSCSGSGKIDHITLPEGNTIWYVYDSFGNLSTIKDSQNNSINYTYDSEGNKLTEQIKDSTGSLQKTLSYQYDQLNRLKRITNPDASYTEYSLDFRGNRISLRNPNSALSTYVYDALGRLKTVNQPGAVDTIYDYDTNNNLTSVKDANTNTTIYKYDDKGRVYQVISPDTGTTTYSYDSAGNLTSKTDAKGVSISYSYDALNRLTLINFPSDTDITYAYDTCLNGKGRLCSMADASGTTSYEYSPKGHVSKETKVIDSHTYITQYTYDQNGNMKTMTYPSGKVIIYNYTNDRAVSVLNGAANLATNISYKPFGGMNGITYGNGLTSSIGYDTQYRLSSLTTSTFQNLTYGYDNNGNITSIAPGKTFTYDALDRLGTANGPWGALGWTYDGVGNRQTENANTYTYAPNTNKLSAANGINFNYDNNGNTTTEASRVYTYNQNQRLIQVVDGAMTAGYTYNGNGQRVRKNVNGTVTIFHYSLNGQIIAESNSAGTITAEYVYLNGQPLVKMEVTNTYYYHNDHLGTPQKMTDASGTVVWSADYKPFGEATVDPSSTITNNLRFPGQYYDVETGLNYNYRRDYNPIIGRYIEADPLNLGTAKRLFPKIADKIEAIYKNNPASQHLYVYVGNNPIGWIDPLGLKAGDGCGDEKTDCIVPDLYPEACKKHDECYGTPGKTKAQCDNQFWWDTFVESGPWPNVIGPTFFWIGVVIGGGDAYNNAQGTL